MCNYCTSHNIFDEKGNRVRGMTGQELQEEEDWFDAPRGSLPSAAREHEDPGFDHGDDPRL